MEPIARISAEHAATSSASGGGTQDQPRGTPNPSSGFTLLELLVVMGLIALLAGLLGTVIIRTKNAAHSIKCRGNLKQIGVALRMYLDENNVYPSGHVSLSSGQRLFWVDLVGPDLNFQQSELIRNGILNCPGRRSPSPSSVDYGYNYEGYAGLGLGPDLSLSSPANSLVGEQDVAIPSEMIAFGDGLVRQGPYVFNDHGPVLRRVLQNYDSSVLQNGPIAQRLAERRHAGFINLVFCDGHVQRLSLERAFLSNRNDDLAKWNRDHQPHRPEWERALKWSPAH